MRKCIACNQEFEGRVDKIFCTSYCKSNYHYKKSKEKKGTLYARIDKQLKLNRRLLLHFNQSGKSTIRRHVLTDAGFNPNLYTHQWINRRGQTYKFCYDQGFLEIMDNRKEKYLLVVYQENYMSVLDC